MFDSECTSTLSLIDEEIGKTLAGIERGIEKEGLRVLPNNQVAQTSHHKALGSTLTHPSITTDYSEALLEFITPKQDGVDDTVGYLTDLHSFTLANIDDEVIWPSSMPCRLEGDQSIPIADYGCSNVGTLKHVYRQGLGVRYGRLMQSIAGIHYNFSLPESFWRAYQIKLNEQESGPQQSLQDFKSAHYFSLIRNFRRYSWILHYLFGASPVLDSSFLAGRSDHGLEQLVENTHGLKYATSLRMSDLGYQNSAQEALHVSYSSLDEYVATLGEAMTQGYTAYEDIGVKRNGEFIQLNTNVLQIENEYYSDIRPKRVTQSGEKPIAALRDRGVEYIEVRILDINPFIAEGIDAQQIRFLDAFLLYCLLSQCPNSSVAGCPEIRGNQKEVITRGRDPSLTLIKDGKKVPFASAAGELLDALSETAAVLDSAHNTNDYAQAVTAQRAKVDRPQLTPSGIMMSKVEQGTEFVDIARQCAMQHKASFASHQTPQPFAEELAKAALMSLQEQADLESHDDMSFEEYLDAYNQS
jgi:glutamate--cysteine ligase